MMVHYYNCQPPKFVNLIFTFVVMSLRSVYKLIKSYREHSFVPTQCEWINKNKIKNSILYSE